MTDHFAYLAEAVRLADANAAGGGSPYGAVIVRDRDVIVRAVNTVHRSGDPTAHAEMVALREASGRFGREGFADSVLYASGRPCPMCHAAMRLAGIREAYFAFTAEEADRHGLDTAGLYTEMCRPLDEQPMQVRYLPVEGLPNPYATWVARRG